jgi:uncharacterized membrane protein YedE/YeeE
VTVTEFTPLASTIGGVLVGVSAVMLMLFNGRIAGISGILGRLFPPYGDTDPGGATAFVIGLIVAPLVYAAVMGRNFLTGSAVALVGDCLREAHIRDDCIRECSSKFCRRP